MKRYKDLTNKGEISQNIFNKLLKENNGNIKTGDWNFP